MQKKQKDFIKREIRSFVIRGRKESAAACHCFSEDLAAFSIEDNLPRLSDSCWESVCLEIGFGAGDFVFNSALNNNCKLYLGVEVYKPGVKNLLKKINLSNVKNILIGFCDVNLVLRKFIPDQFLNEIFILFPDPWPKRKHHKRRLVNHEFLCLLNQKMAPGAFINFTTEIFTIFRPLIIKEMMSELITKLNLKIKL